MLFDPVDSLQVAVYKRLTDVPIVINGEQINAYEFAPAITAQPAGAGSLGLFETQFENTFELTAKVAGNNYILITQQTATPLNGAQSCKRWECTLLLDIVTSFAKKNQVSSLLSAQIAEEVLSRFIDQRLPLEGGFGISPSELIMSQTLVDNPTVETVDVHRYLRMRFFVEAHQ